MRLLKRSRGALGMGLAWGTVWGLAGAVLSTFLRAVSNAGSEVSLLDRLFDFAWVGWYGFLGGLIFSVVLGLAARRRSLLQLKGGRVAAWGAATAALFLTPPYVYMLRLRPDGWRPADAVWIGGALLLSVGCAVGSWWLARRAELRMRGGSTGSESGSLPRERAEPIKSADAREPAVPRRRDSGDAGRNASSRLCHPSATFGHSLA